MLNQKAMGYVDDVISRISAPEGYKAKLRSALLRRFIDVPDSVSYDEIVNLLGSPAKFADIMSSNLTNILNKELDNIFETSDKRIAKYPEKKGKAHEEHVSKYDDEIHKPKKCRGEYTREESEVDISLLFIPLLQISSGVEKIHCYFDEMDFPFAL
jgi:hypothetical protein